MVNPLKANESGGTEHDEDGKIGKRNDAVLPNRGGPMVVTLSAGARIPSGYWRALRGEQGYGKISRDEQGYGRIPRGEQGNAFDIELADIDEEPQGEVIDTDRKTGEVRIEQDPA